MSQQHKHTASQYLPLLLSVLFIGTSGPLGRLIHISPVAIICFRSVIALVLLITILKITKKSLVIKDKKKRNFILISGIFLAAHWVSYFFALKLSSIALGMLSLFTYPVITVILEPFYLKKEFRLIQIPVALLALAGLYILLPDFDIKNQNTIGVLIGVVSAFFYACRNLIIKKHAAGQDEMLVISYQLAVVSLLTAPVLLFVPVSIDAIKTDWHYLVILGVVTTAMGHSFYVKSLQHFSASTVSILSNFTPVVGIVLGIIFLQENPGKNILLGGSMILLTALLEVWIGMRRKQKQH